MKYSFLILLLLGGLMAAFMMSHATAKPGKDIMPTKPADKPVAVFAGGCFWCTESEFRRLDGVLFTRVGYAGGIEDNPTYEMVSAHKTDYAEVTEVTFDPAITSFEKLTEFFLTQAHDPTELDRQGPDVGRQYRSAIFYATPEEKAIAEKVIARVNAAHTWPKPIVTTIEPLTKFWEAEGYHQQYFENYKKKYGIPHINDVMHAK